MVMPLGDEHPTRIVPVVTYAIIALNVLAFVVQQSRPESFTIAYAATPYEITYNRDMIPSLGASGAIAGVMGMYVLWFPDNRVRVLVWYTLTWMPALLVIGLWIVLQLVLGMGRLSTVGQEGGVAYAAHVGGAVARLVFGVVYRERARAPAERSSDLGWAPTRYRSPYGYRPYR